MAGNFVEAIRQREIGSLVQGVSPKCEWKPDSLDWPPGEYKKDSGYIPDCYQYYRDLATSLKTSYSIDFQVAGLSIPVSPDETATAAALLSYALVSDMRTTIPHFLLTMTKENSPVPAYCARTIIGAYPDRRIASIVDEFITPGEIRFIDQPPWCIFKKDPEYDVPENTVGVSPQKLIAREICTRLEQMGIAQGDRSHLDDFARITILAGVAKISQSVLDKVRQEVYFKDHLPEKTPEFELGSRLMNISRLMISFLGWQDDKRLCNNPHFIVATARMANPHKIRPQAYNLHRLFSDLSWNDCWLGKAVIRAGAERTAPTGAVVIARNPDQYDLDMLRLKKLFYEALEKYEKGKQPNIPPI